MKVIKTCFVVFSGLSYLYGPALTFADCDPKPTHPCAGLVYEAGATLYSDNSVGNGTKKLRDLNLGDFFFIVGSSGTWFQVDPLKGGKGWVEKQYIHTYYVSLLTGKGNKSSANIYSLPDENSKVSAELLPGEMFRFKEIAVSAAGVYWVYFQDSPSLRKEGWVSLKDIELISAGVLREAGGHTYRGPHTKPVDLDKGLVFLNLLAERYSETAFLFPEPFTSDELHYGGVDANIYEGYFYALKKEYAKAIEKLKIVTEKYPRKPLPDQLPGVMAYLKMAEIYKEINNRDMASKMYKEVIFKFPDSAINMDHNWMPGDMTAATELFNMWKGESPRLLKEAEEIISNPSAGQEAKAFAHLKTIEARIDKGDTKGVLNALSAFIKEMPTGKFHCNAYRPYFYSMSAIGLFFETTFENFKDDKKATSVCRNFGNSLSDINLRAYAEYKLVQIKDKKGGEAKALIEAYSKLKTTFIGVDFTFPDWTMNMASEDAGFQSRINKRLQELSVRS